MDIPPPISRYVTRLCNNSSAFDLIHRVLLTIYIRRSQFSSPLTCDDPLPFKSGYTLTLCFSFKPGDHDLTRHIDVKEVYRDKGYPKDSDTKDQRFRILHMRI
jgi:hypothetical protein